MLSKFSRFCRQCLAICLRIDALVRRVSAAKTVDEDVKGVGFQPIIAPILALYRALWLDRMAFLQWDYKDL